MITTHYNFALVRLAPHNASSIRLVILFMPRCGCASEVYGSVFVCVCVYVSVSVVDCYSCSRINEVQVRVSMGF